ncbi:MAG: D-tyrosyl-tRNA(Tyr) deacylase [Clostridia bacterium]|nr:D-tyrosyl-tRNA(Tyr) deacylase [Clostridia bacterium]
MKALIQRVLSSDVVIDGETVGSIGKGYNILLGVVEGDTEEQARELASKIVKLRIFDDQDGKMNLSIADIDGEIIVVSQFTLCADCRKGNRPSFISSAPPAEANALYEYFCSLLREQGVKKVEQGVFGADMKVTIVNDGPVTIWLDSDIFRQSRRGGNPQ